MYAVEDFKAGQMLGDYELLVPIAQGGTASVWAARQRGLHGFEKIVAIKVMLAELCDDLDAESMFLDEARLMSRIGHVNVVKVIDFGEDKAADALYIVMEWIDGEPLQVITREARKHGGFPLSIATQMIKQACAGLHAAHELRDEDGELVGLVHRDVSPQNIMVDYDGRVKIIDFGVAKAASNQQRTAVGQLKGKAAYMAPEQARGDKVDRRTDVFALGIVLYQMVTGKHPFRADNEFATMKMIRDDSPVAPPSTLVPSLPPALDQVIVKALSKDPAARFATMNELNKALERAQPSGLNGVEEIARFMTTLLGPRAEKKRAALREALLHGSDNLTSLPSLLPSAIQDPVSTSGAWHFVDEETAQNALKTPLPIPAPAPVPSATPAPSAAPAPETSLAGLPALLRKGPSMKVIAIIVAALVVLGVAAVMALGSNGPSAPPGEPVRKAW